MAYNRDLQVYNIVYSLHCFLFQLGQRLVDLIHYLQSPLQERTKMSQIFSISWSVYFNKETPEQQLFQSTQSKIE